jgi:hypothetical protein
MIGNLHSSRRGHVKRRDYWFEISIIWFVLLLGAVIWFFFA